MPSFELCTNRMQAARVNQRGRKFTGSPIAYQRKTAKFYQKKGKMVTDAVTMHGNILYGWFVDCSCGVRAANYYDNHQMIQCDICQLWMHCSCNKVPTSESGQFKYFKRKRVWVCPCCSNGEFRYRGAYWNIPEEEKTTIISFQQEDQTRGNHPFEIPPFDPSAEPNMPILRIPTIFPEVKLPTPTSPLEQLSL